MTYLSDSLYMGDHIHRNFPVYRGVGGHGGGSIEITAHYFELDGHISANGEMPHSSYSAHAGTELVQCIQCNIVTSSCLKDIHVHVYTFAGGGAGGSVWIKATKAFGHGSIAVSGGDGVSNGGGGSAGRISVQAAHVENWNVTMIAVGGLTSQ